MEKEAVPGVCGHMGVVGFFVFLIGTHVFPLPFPYRPF